MDFGYIKEETVIGLNRRCDRKRKSWIALGLLASEKGRLVELSIEVKGVEGQGMA